MTEASLTERALHFATEWHRGQKRNHSGAPYVFHPVEVAKWLTHALICDPDILSAALLHDVVEDTPATQEMVLAEFGPRVAGFVDEMTHDEVNVSKVAYLESFAGKSDEALAIKLLDRYCNVKDYVRDRPEYAPEYAAKALVVYDAVDRRREDFRNSFGDDSAQHLAELSAELRRIAATE